MRDSLNSLSSTADVAAENQPQKSRKPPKCGPDCIRRTTIDEWLAIADGTFVDDPAAHADCGKPYKPLPKPLIHLQKRVEYIHRNRSFQIRSETFHGTIPIVSLRKFSHWEEFVRKCRAHSDEHAFELIDEIEEGLWHNGYDVTFGELMESMGVHNG